ncbi:MarC family protein [Paracoccus tegillarcae]|uniref:UPF0056 membrane protein n=1 Tax=Paracoccus tegillarcae TaxID=1529068 RepID=A0A2K9EVT8_9RHOB|nr:MarC family protein [Paracoccus tegillarcae]AUH32162.1 MarC family transcriptional regulator [Paracoccus tegillarcae]
MDIAPYITAFVTLFVVIDPIGLAPLFIALTRDMQPPERRRVGWRAVGISFVLLTLFALAGEQILGAIGISLSAFRIAGGILLLLTAFDMLFERRTERREGQSVDDADDPSVFPLATPLLAGPGALATMILLVGQGDGWGHLALILVVMALVLAVALILFEAAGPLARALGRTGTMVVTRLLGMLLAALSIQFIIDGLMGSGLV